jgi:hypothetical protein
MHRFVADWVGVGTELHVRRYGMMRDEARQGPYFSKHPYFIYLGHNSIKNFSLEWTEHNGSIFDRVHHKPLT